MTIPENNIAAARPIPESYWVLPGRLLAGEYPGVFSSSWGTRQRLTAFLDAGFHTFINLTMQDELDDYTLLLQQQAAAYGAELDCLRLPIDDFDIPTHKKMTEILDAIDLALANERKVYVHCYGGIGRTGTVVGCFLVRRGLTGQQALEQLALWWRSVPKSAHHPHSPETSQQAKFVLHWSEG